MNKELHNEIVSEVLVVFKDYNLTKIDCLSILSIVKIIIYKAIILDNAEVD
jgi:hypothetical protein